MSENAAKRMTDKEWADIRNEYASSSLGYRKLAEKYGVSFNTLKDRAVKEKWSEDKTRFREKYTKTTQQNLARRRACACARDLNKIGKAAGNISAGINKLLRDSKQFKRYIVTEGVGDGCSETKEKVFDKYDTRAIRDLASAMKDLTHVVRDVYGMPGIVEQSAMDMALARLVMEQTKADNEKGARPINLIVVDPADKEKETPA